MIFDRNRDEACGKALEIFEEVQRIFRAQHADNHDERTVARIFPFSHERGQRLATIGIVPAIEPDLGAFRRQIDQLAGQRGIDAGFGLGEALVSGVSNADHYKVDRRTGQVLVRRIAKPLRAYRRPDFHPTQVGHPDLAAHWLSSHADRWKAVGAAA